MKPIQTEAIYSFSIARNVLLAVQLFQSTDETRSAIACTRFLIRGEALTLVATDGRRLATYDDRIISDSLLTGALPEHEEFSIDLSGAKKLPKAKGAMAGQVSVAVFEAHVELQSERYTYRAQKVAEPYPNWRDVLPKGPPEPTPGILFNHKLLSSFGKAAKLLTEKETLHFVLRGNGAPIEVTLNGDADFRGVLMPVVLSDESKAEPTATETKDGKKGPALK